MLALYKYYPSGKVDRENYFLCGGRGARSCNSISQAVTASGTPPQLTEQYELHSVQALTTVHAQGELLSLTKWEIITTLILFVNANVVFVY